MSLELSLEVSFKEETVKEYEEKKTCLAVVSEDEK